ncbi:hypothetical protein [Streptomyces sp. SID8111]|uniref:hypothetical protein n=1 Tax=Streptomyces sp. SID8111 TaxID=2706100 RepID=UPI001EF31852|nr:hypothetical protein [Streptomyces sp. SID8111]
MDRTETARRLLGNDAAHQPYAGPARGSDGHTPIYTALVAEWRARGQTVPGHREARWASFAAATVSERGTPPTPTVPAARSVPFRIPVPVLPPEPARAPGREPEADADTGADGAGPGHTGADGGGGTEARGTEAGATDARATGARATDASAANAPAANVHVEMDADAWAGAHLGTPADVGTDADAATATQAGPDTNAWTDGDHPGGDHPHHPRDDAPAPGGHPALHLRAAPPGEALTSRPAPPAPH